MQNGAFEYNRADSIDWSNYSFWRKIVPEGSFAAFGIHDNDPVATENPHYATVEVEHAPAALDSTGWDGMVFRAGETYDFTAWMRVRSESAMPVTVSLRGDDGNIIAENTITVSVSAWTTYQASLTVPEHGDAGSSVATQGNIASGLRRRRRHRPRLRHLEPRTTYHGLKHFRPDLVEALADLKPRFMRFPGGCITHGLGMDNMYHWDRTIGPVEHRPHNFNLWGYHQSFRIGYYEYLCLCETIGAKPLPVLPAGVSCQNTSQGPVPVAQEDMPAYIDEVLHLIEFCNGSTATEWGAKRAAMGHPEPFGLEYLGIGNEDLIDDVFKNRFQQIFDAVKAAYPDIVVVGTVGPAPSGQDYEEGWKYAREAESADRRRTFLPVVQLVVPQPRPLRPHGPQGPKVYLGEYGSWNTQLDQRPVRSGLHGTHGTQRRCGGHGLLRPAVRQEWAP